MNSQPLESLKNIFLIAQVIEATDGEATVQLKETLLSGVPILYPAGLQQSVQPGSQALLLCPAGELDHAAMIPLGGAPNHQLYERFNAALKLFNDLLNTLHSQALKQVRGGDEGASAAAYLVELQSALAALQNQFSEEFDPPENPLGFLL